MRGSAPIMRRAYLAQVESAPDITPETRARLQAVRRDIERASSPSKFAVNMLTGLRHQSNVSAEPAGSDIIAGGIPLTLSSVFLHKPGWDAFVGGNLTHTYDFGGATLESNALVYYSKQFRFSSIDSAAVEVNSGPRFDVGGSGASKFVSLRPYALASDVLFGQQPICPERRRRAGGRSPHHGADRRRRVLRIPRRTFCQCSGGADRDRHERRRPQRRR